MELIDILREGMFIAFCVATGEESGSRCSASIEWCRLVQAREKSSPRECLGSEVAGLPVWLCDCMYEWMLVCSSRGLSGAVVESCAGLGIWRFRPRERKSGRRVVLGVVGTALSSLLSRRNVSRKEGEGARVAGGSERLLCFAGDLDGVLASKAGGRKLFMVQNWQRMAIREWDKPMSVATMAVDGYYYVGVACKCCVIAWTDEHTGMLGCE
jgi:hypothetical protein